MNHTELKIGDRVWYAPSLNGPRFAAVVASEPWKLGGHTWCVRLEDLGQEYQEYTHKHGRSVVAAAAVNNVFRSR